MKSIIHNKEIEYILSNISGVRPCHSWIFFGSKGIGKMHSAMKIAKQLLNTNNDQHPDIKVICPQESKDSISIEQIREIKTFLSLKSAISPYKIIIIDAIDEVSYQGCNALLKCLEEPTDKTFIFLISHNISRVLPTIRSRALEVKFNDLSYEECREILKDNYGSRDDFIESLILSDHNPGKARELIDFNIVASYKTILKLIGTNFTSSDLKQYEANLPLIQQLIIRLISIINKNLVGCDTSMIKEEQEVLQNILKQNNLHKIMQLWQKTIENYQNQDIYNLDIKTNLYLTLSELG